MKNKIINKTKELSSKNNHLHLLLAVSGGVDSMVMLDFFNRNQSQLDCRLSVCHINHNYHAKSLKMSQIVFEYCNKNNLEHFNIVLKKRLLKNNVESQLRKKRYNELEKIRKKINADYILTAHHFNDQVETALMRILNSSSLESIMGIKTLNGLVFRPMIDVSKEEIELYAKKHKVSYGLDPTNNDLYLTRNFLRKKVIPLLEEIKPNLNSSFKDLEDKISDVNDLLDFSTKEFINSNYVRINEKTIYIQKEYFLKLPFLMKINILRTIASEKRKFYFSKNLLRELKFFLNKQVIGSTKIINDFLITIDREFIVLTSNMIKDDVYCEVKEGRAVENDNFYFCWNYDKKPKNFSNNSNIEYVDATNFKSSLVLRSINRNDKFSPLGMDGTKKVNDYLTDNKISLMKKSEILAVCNNNDIVWIAGERINNNYRLTKNSKIIAKLNFLRK
jgi:tRNA(Ile)-lysidine synthase